MEQMIPYIKEETKTGTRLNQIMRHTIGLFHGQKGSSYWKRYLSENMCIREADLQKVNHIMDHIKNNNNRSLLSEDKLLETLDQNQIIFFVIVMAVAAIPVGFVAGLFGVGGGLNNSTCAFLYF